MISTTSFTPSSTLMSSKLPLSSLSVSSPQGSVSAPHPRSKSPKPSPIQMPPSSAALQCPSPNPVQGSSGLFGYMTSASTLPGLQSPANFMLSPSSQYAAILNQYLHMMSPQSVMGGNKQPLVINDPMLLQSLQHAVIVLPDGTVAPANLNLDAAQKSTSQPCPVKPLGSKRAHSPENEASKHAPLPKRRRSSSLPDITQLSSVTDKNSPIHEDKEGEERETEIKHERESKHDEIRKREMPPLNMTNISKVHDPMLGFPTPPQSSPHFASSPLILPTAVSIFQPHPMTPMTPSQNSFSQEDIKELVGEATAQTPLPASPDGVGLPPCELVLYL